MRAALLAGPVLALALGGTAALAAGPEVSPDEMEQAKRVSWSLWAVVPELPARKRDLRAEQIAGSAVAVGPGRLLVACEVVGGRAEVALWRHGEYRVGRLAGSEPTGRVCVLSAPEAPLNLPGGVRDPGDLRPGEPIYAVFNETSAAGVLAKGRLVAARRGEVWATLALPAGARSAVLFDAAGNLIGLGAADAGAAGTVVATSLDPALAPALARFGLEAASPTAGDASATPVPAPEPVSRSAALSGGGGDDDSDDASGMSMMMMRFEATRGPADAPAAAEATGTRWSGPGSPATAATGAGGVRDTAGRAAGAASGDDDDDAGEDSRDGPGNSRGGAKRPGTHGSGEVRDGDGVTGEGKDAKGGKNAGNGGGAGDGHDSDSDSDDSGSAGDDH